MKFLEFISAVNLFEAAKDRYTQMFTNLSPVIHDLATTMSDDKSLMPVEKELQDHVNEEIEWAMNTLKKQDKIIWYLRFIKVDMIAGLVRVTEQWTQEKVNAGASLDSPETTAALMKIKDVYAKARTQLSKKMGLDADQTVQAVGDALNPRFKRKVEHFMSLGIAGIEEYVFSNQTPRQILDDWTPIEDAWKARRKSTLPIDREGIDTVIKYPDGSEWVNLNKEYCTDEGEAMGHCGNSATPKEGDTVLSYRTIEEVDGEQLWKPRLTFILDKNGLLGETKGRANQKPDKKYHDVIVDLLRQDFVKGIKGGGHEAENNFKLADLPQDVTEKLHEEKPGLADIEYDYGKRGMTKELLQRMEGMWEDTQIAFPTYHKPTSSDGHFRNDTRYNMQEFLDAYGGHSGKYIGRVLNGDEHIDIAYDGAPIDDLFGELSPDIQHRVGEWIIDEHPELVEEWKEENDKDYDGTDARDTWSIIQEYEISEITDALERGYWRGDEVGAESAMYKSLESWLTELPNEHDFALELSPGWDGSDSRQELIIPEVEMINIMSNHLDEVTYASDLDEFAKIKELESPYNGWEGHDDDAAKEEAEQQLYEAGVLTG